MLRSFYRASVQTFLSDVKARELAPLLVAEAEHASFGNPSRGEVESWKRSLPALADVLDHPDFQSDGIFVELLMPISSARCDVLLTGRDPRGRASAVVVELKQWQHVALASYPEHVLAHGELRLHPSEQVRGYVQHLRMFSAAFHEEKPEPLELYGAVYLHNLPEGPALQLLTSARNFQDLPRRYPIFAAHQAAELRGFLRERLVPGPGHDVAERIATSPVKPSPKLLDHVVATIEGRDEWQLLDRQKTAYWAISSATTRARESDERKVIIVKGGPGTGKSVIAIQLLAHGAREGWSVVHATGSKAFQTVLQAKMIEGSNALLRKIHGVKLKKDLPVSELFTTFADAAKISGKVNEGKLGDRVDLIVADEAHRLWEYRRKKYPNGKVEWLTHVPMVEELLNSTRVAAFFLDDNQSVRPGEVGKASVIAAHADRLGIPVETIDLQRQFRCGGSLEYIEWVDALLGFRATWPDTLPYAVEVAVSMPAAVDALERARLHGARCRIVAGYCWKWSKPRPGSTPNDPRLVHDLTDPRLEGWSGPWIEKTGQHLKPLQNQYTRWSTDERLHNQVGSIYSAQGFEFDRVLVLWGEDLVWRGDRWVAQPDRNKDGAFKKEIATLAGKDRDAQARAAVDKLRNVYRVLLTRGMAETTVIILDEETRSYVRACLASMRVPCAAQR